MLPSADAALVIDFDLDLVFGFSMLVSRRQYKPSNTLKMVVSM